jgi:acetylornithine deacetylase/succinyl-diaminopimelate desuccinylase-like protein
MNLSPKISSYQFCTNGSYSAGVAGIPTIGFGPSYEHMAHIVDEYVEIDQLIQAADGYYSIAKSLLSKEGAEHHV